MLYAKYGILFLLNKKA